MCGIIGYMGRLNAKEVLIGGLERLEYRGYDSAGIAFIKDTVSPNPPVIIKKTGKVNNLKDTVALDNSNAIGGIGHTRWATHGRVTEVNAHPHTDENVTLIHNGIIENYQEILSINKFNTSMKSDTDTEVAAKLLNYLYEINEHNPIASIRDITKLINGTYAFCILFKDRPNELYAIRRVSPLIAAQTKDGTFIASDITAFIPYTNIYSPIPEDVIVKLTADEIVTINLDESPVILEKHEVTWNMEAAQKNGYPHFMIKEIYEQPKAIADTLLPRIINGLPDLSIDEIPDEIFKNIDKIQIIACGTAMHAGIVARSLMEPILSIPVNISIASEFRYENPIIDEKTLVFVISQSGETIDTLAALSLAKEKGSKTIAIVNVKGSTISRESDFVFYTHAGPEIAVASTKAYTVQIAALYIIGCRMAFVRKSFNETETKLFIENLLNISNVIEKTLLQDKNIKNIITHITNNKDAFFIGRGRDYAFSLEGALKLKEISYIHAEAYAAGELKHGTIALIENGIPVIALATQDRLLSKTISNIREVKARGAFVILIVKENTNVNSDVYDICLRIPTIENKLTVFPIAVLLQLIAYHAACEKGVDVDRPRNLAKSVTVE
jgi:glucosamine--fructose-6-phosphate aminotransferase (isomerizing)